jgi:hypothetical protein
MRDVETGELIPLGEPDAKARFFYEALHPLTHADRYGNASLHFILGGADTHVPPDGARRFRTQLEALGRGEIMTITELPGKRHLDFVDPEVWLDNLTIINANPC